MITGSWSFCPQVVATVMILKPLAVCTECAIPGSGDAHRWHRRGVDARGRVILPGNGAARPVSQVRAPLDGQASAVVKGARIVPFDVTHSCVVMAPTMTFGLRYTIGTV